MMSQQDTPAMSSMALPGEFASHNKAPFAATNPLPSPDFYNKVGGLLEELEKRHWKNHVYSPQEVLR